MELTYSQQSSKSRGVRLAMARLLLSYDREAAELRKRTSIIIAHDSRCSHGQLSGRIFPWRLHDVVSADIAAENPEFCAKHCLSLFLATL